MITLGGPVFLNSRDFYNYGVTLRNEDDLEEFISKVKEKGFKAVYCPVVELTDSRLLSMTRETLAREGIVIAECGYWDNLLDLNPERRKKTRRKMIEYMIMADELGAKCTINTVGALTDGNHRDHCAANFSEEAFEEVVKMTKELLDGAKPVHTKLSYEIYQWHLTDSTQEIKRLCDAIDDERFAVHLDLVNLLNCPRRYWRSFDVAKEFIDTLGSRLVSAHVKDVWMNQGINDDLEFHEVPAGRGQVDIAGCMRLLSELPQDVPYMMEHLKDEEEYDLVAAYLRKTAEENGIALR